jgi:hypothetical protein
MMLRKITPYWIVLLLWAGCFQAFRTDWVSSIVSYEAGLVLGWSLSGRIRGVRTIQRIDRCKDRTC